MTRTTYVFSAAAQASGWQFNCKKWLENSLKKRLENPLEFPLNYQKGILLVLQIQS